MKALTLTLFAIVLFSGISFAQCCAGGAGSPIAGGTSQGVLAAQQFELNTNLQFINSSVFYTGDSRDTNKYFDQFRSAYQYLRFAYGVTSDFTMSIETGNFFHKEEIGLNDDPSKTYKSSGIGDLIIFPRYDILNLTTDKSKTEITVGLGYKIPIGSYNDSTGNVEPFSGETYYVTNPQAVQLTTGAQDIIFYTFLYKGYPAKNIRFFANALYIKKGWNPLGEKMGDFASIGLFVGKSFFGNLGATLQLRGEYMAEMKLNPDILMYAYPNYDPYATGYKKVFVTPQVSYTLGKFSFYALADIPVYQYVTKTQVGTQFQATAGISFRFFAMKSKFDKIEMGDYSCPMHPDVTSSFKGACPKCGMDLELKK
jgi:hypothetical protein